MRIETILNYVINFKIYFKRIASTEKKKKILEARYLALNWYEPEDGMIQNGFLKICLSSTFSVLLCSASHKFIIVITMEIITIILNPFLVSKTRKTFDPEEKEKIFTISVYNKICWWCLSAHMTSSRFLERKVHFNINCE